VDHQSFAHGWTGSGSTCTAQSPVGLNATAAVAYTAGQSSATTTLGMKATSSGESTQNDWKQFATPSGSHKPTLSVTYLTKPSVPSPVKMSSPALACATSSSAPVSIADSTPTLSATVLDGDGSSATLQATFEVYTGATKVWSATSSGLVASGAAVTATTTALTNGTTYYYHARTDYQWAFGSLAGTDSSSFSSPCYFKVDTRAPTQHTVAATVNGTATIASAQINPDLRGVNIPQVQARDAAGNTSSTREYAFKVAPGTGPVDVWTLDAGSGTTLADSNTVGTTHQATLSGGRGSSCWW
jgi:hypothetical protein